MRRAEQALSSRGEKLHTHAMHIRRIAEGKFIAEHELADRNGNPPEDPRRARREYSLNDHRHLANHVERAMAPPPPDDEANEPPGPEEAEPGEPGA